MAINEFCYSERVALTVEQNAVPTVWTAEGDGSPRVFGEGDKKAILRSEDGWWNRAKTTEPNGVEWAQYWMGEFPYGSWCWAIRRYPDGRVTVRDIETEINPRGLSESEEWIRDTRCQVVTATA